MGLKVAYAYCVVYFTSGPAYQGGGLMTISVAGSIIIFSVAILFIIISLILASKLYKLKKKYTELSNQDPFLVWLRVKDGYFMRDGKIKPGLGWFSVAFLTVILGVVFILGAAEPDLKFDIEPDVKPGDVYMASSTISGLAVFGSILGLRISGGVSTYTNKLIGVTTMICGSIGVVIIQGWIMHFACCIGLNNMIFTLYLFGTTTTLATIMLGFTIILDVWIKQPSTGNDA